MTEFKRFSLGLRFAMTEDAALTPEAVRACVCAEVPLALVEGLTLSFAWDDTSDCEPEPAYLCIFSGMSLKRAKRLFRVVEANQRLCSYLTAYMPFVQNNWVEKCGKVEQLGKIARDGTFDGGDTACDGLRFCCAAQETALTERRPHLLLAAESLGDGRPSADVARRLMRTAVEAFPKARITVERICDGGRGTVDTMVAACCGRYLLCKEPLVRCGVLPNRTVVFETEQLTDEQVEQTLQKLMRDGYRTFMLAAGKRRMHVAFPEEIAVTVLSNPVSKQPYGNSQLTYASGVETVLHYGDFLRACGEADAVVLATTAHDESCALLGATADTIRFYCERNHVPFCVLARLDESSYVIRPSGCEAEKMAATELDAAARALFARLNIIEK